MPTDKGGKFHLNSQRAHASDRAVGGKPGKELGGEGMKESDKGGTDGGPSEHTITPKGDGTFSSDGPGGHEEHPNLGHAITHAAHHLGGGGKHMHHHGSGGSIQSHGMTEGGEHTDEQHGSGEEAGAHTASFMGEGEEGHDAENQEQQTADHGFGLAGF